MQTPGEELVGEYLKHIYKCDFVQYNVQLSQVQGEIDVVGINLSTRTLYVCEVAVHLVTGLQYNRPDNINRFITKFTKDIQYARSALPDYEHVFMLWSPIVKQRANPKYDQLSQVQTVHDRLKADFDVDLQVIINESFQHCMIDLRTFAATQTKAFASPIMRLLQIEEYVAQHLQQGLWAGR